MIPLFFAILKYLNIHSMESNKFSSFILAGAFAAFFTTAYNKKDETEFQISGIKGRPLPDLPKPYSDAKTNGTRQIESDYDEIPAHRLKGNSDKLPYSDLSTFMKSRADTVSEDSAPSSPTRNLSQSSFKEQRSRSSTQGSPDSTFNDTSFTVPHDSTGNYFISKHLVNTWYIIIINNELFI